MTYNPVVPLFGKKLNRVNAFRDPWASRETGHLGYTGVPGKLEC